MQSVIKQYESSIVQDRIKEGIENNRKANCTVYVTDTENKPIYDAKIKLTQKRHDFNFGVNIFMLGGFKSNELNEKYERVIANLFNMGVVPIYWDMLEPQRGKPRFKKDSPFIYRRPPVDVSVEFCEKYGITPKAHCLSFDFFEPDWVRKESYFEHNVALEERFRALSENYSTKIKYWEVINETLFTDKEAFKTIMTDFYFEPDLVEWAFDKAKKYFPNNILTINENALNIYPEFKGNRSNYYLLIERLLREKYRVDKLGFQAHFIYDLDYIKKFAQPDAITSFFERYADFKLPMQITEVSVPAKIGDIFDYTLQAELARYLYSLWFSLGFIDEIVYWNMPDGYAAFAEPGDMRAGENSFYAGLVDYELNEKPIYKELDRLINKEWRTNLNLKTGADGKVEFRGFKGTYEAQVTAMGKTITTKIEVGKQTDISIKL